MNRPFDNFLERLEGVRKSSEGYEARCPSPKHGRRRGDLNPSLSLGEGHDGRVLVKCLAGCSLADIVGAIGLDERDLFERNDSGEGGINPPTNHGQRVNRR